MTDTDTTRFRVFIDRDKCVGHGRCYSLAPAVYDADDEGFGELTGGETVGTSQLLEQAQLGVDSCPERAISLIPL